MQYVDSIKKGNKSANGAVEGPTRSSACRSLRTPRTSPQSLRQRAAMRTGCRQNSIVATSVAAKNS
jgi:hypothetical protein